MSILTYTFHEGMHGFVWGFLSYTIHPDSAHIRDGALVVRVDAAAIVAYTRRTSSRCGDVVAFICVYKLPFPYTLAGIYGTVFRSSVG